jgi:DNA-binding NtrC family response regulator
VRELENAIERAILLQRDCMIQLDCLPAEILEHCVSEKSAGYGPVVKSEEQLMVEAVLRMFGGDKSKTARSIGWTRPKLYRRLRQFGIQLDFGRARPVARELIPSGRAASASGTAWRG